MAEVKLYVCESGFHCQMARLALVEKGVEHKLVHVNLSALEQVRATAGRGNRRSARSRPLLAPALAGATPAVLKRRRVAAR
jgi:hypothetical protein